MRIVIVDRYPIVRLGLKQALPGHLGFQVVAESDELCSAVSLAREKTADMVILGCEFRSHDLLGHKSILHLCGDIKRVSAAIVVIVFAAGEPESALFLQMSDIDGYLTKEEQPENIVQTIRETACGKRVWRMGSREADEVAAHVRVGCLTMREREVLALLLFRLSNHEIAQSLQISVNTVKNHVASILRKLNVTDRSCLVTEFG